MHTADAAATYALDAEQLAKFDRDGFIGPITIYSPEEMADRWLEIRTGVLDRSLAVYPADSYGGNTNISNYDRHLDIDLLSEHVLNPRIVGPVTSILGPDVLCWRTEFFPKYPGDEGTDWHQADTFANASGRPQLVWGEDRNKSAHGGTLTVWTAFTDSTLENGCLQLIPGTHREMNYDETKGMRYRPEVVNSVEKDGVNRGFFGYDYRELQKDPNWKPDESQAFPVVMKAGQSLFFWSTLMHASLPNITENDYRMGFATRYVPPGVKVYPDTELVEEYGGAVPLENWSAVLVAGQDDSGRNRLATESRRGYRFSPR